MTLEELLRQGKSFGQGASNAAASTVTGPVDMLAWLLRKGGVDVGDAPIGGEQWMRNKGLMATPENRLAGLLGEGAGLAAPIVAAAKAPEIAGGLLQMGRNLATPQTMNKQTGAIVYHGSPHKFDKFDSSKIGTGEGAQAYGHGLYFAESPDVAKTYAIDQRGQSAGDMAERYLKNFGNKESALQAAEARLAKVTEEFKPEFVQPYRDAVEMLRTGNIEKGGLYKVDLPDEHIAKMLDWDKPLSQQPHVMELINKQEAARTQSVLDQRMQTLANVGENAPNASVLKRQIDLLREEVAKPQESGLGAMTGGEYYNYLRRRDVAPTVQADMFKQAGIPGIRYLDGGSRGTGAGTSNFVVFPGNEGLLQILERNGQALK